ncbi:MAG TPA: nuclear transport factor 2 family protein [Stellaceae bacterium]|nr:nuclear transport factor 2 family protein [Stellaceae bacterium]
MDDGEAPEQAAVLARLDRLNALIGDRDPAIVDDLWSGPGMLFVGSEPNEIARTREEFAALMASLFAAPFRLAFAWDSRVVSLHGDIAWVFAECHVVFTRDDAVTRTPYRMTCLFQRIDGRWHWRQYFGAEPDFGAEPVD